MKKSDILNAARGFDSMTAWVQSMLQILEPGDYFIYWVGCLHEDRSKVPGLSEMADYLLRMSVKEVFYGVSDDSVISVKGQGQGFLVQKKIKDGRYEYWFIKASPPKPRFMNEYVKLNGRGHHNTPVYL